MKSGKDFLDIKYDRIKIDSNLQYKDFFDGHYEAKIPRNVYI